MNPLSGPSFSAFRVFLGLRVINKFFPISPLLQRNLLGNQEVLSFRFQNIHPFGKVAEVQFEILVCTQHPGFPAIHHFAGKVGYLEGKGLQGRDSGQVDFTGGGVRVNRYRGSASQFVLYPCGPGESDGEKIEFAIISGGHVADVHFPGFDGVASVVKVSQGAVGL